MEINWRDIGQAISDLQLQVIIITFTLVFLSIAGIILGKRGTKLNNASQLDSPRKIRHRFTPAQLQRLSRIGRYAIIEQPKLSESKHEITWRASFWQGISTEFFGAVVTTIFLGLGVLIFDQYQDIQNRKADLILQMGSPDNTIAIEAVRQLDAEGWLQDGTLQGRTLHIINLQGANLFGASFKGAVLDWANLQRAILTSADLQEANLDHANLQGAILTGALLQDAHLFQADLRGAHLFTANLERIYLDRANLQGANLGAANLQGAILYGVNLQEANLWDANLQSANLNNATLPDGSEWTTNTDMSRFTDPNHPNFWYVCIEVDPVPGYC